MRFYSDPTREADPYALPDAETYLHDARHCPNCGCGSDHEDDGGSCTIDCAGWYFRFCLPGCMPDSDPFGPYDTEAEAVAACRDMVTD